MFFFPGSDSNVVAGDYGTVDLSFDFGFRRRVYVGDFVWHDLNGDGNQGAGEPGSHAARRGAQRN